MSVRLLTGNCLEILPTLEADSVQCCVTSPPYFGLRSYNGGVAEIGQEPTVQEFVEAMVRVFREVRRVLRDDGTCWVNLGDSYANDGKWGGHSGGKHAQALHCTPIGRNKKYTGLKPKDLCMIPARVAIALQDDGWYLRQDIIWNKPNPMPESVGDRCTKSHEYLFLLSKSPKYFYDAKAIAEPVTQSTIARLAQNVEGQAGSARVPGKTNGSMKAVGPRFGGSKYGDDPREELRTKSGNEYTGGDGMRNKRSVWTVATQPFKDAHFATFPPKLIEPCILAGTSAKGCCPICRGPSKRVLKPGSALDTSRPQTRRALEIFEQSNLTPAHLDAIRSLGIADTGKALVTSDGAGHNTEEVQRLFFEAKAVLNGYTRELLLATPETVGWAPSCRCDAGDPVPCTVLDPFSGAGTTALVASEHGRHAIGIELNPEYNAIAENRLRDRFGMFADVTT